MFPNAKLTRNIRMTKFFRVFVWNIFVSGKALPFSERHKTAKTIAVKNSAEILYERGSNGTNFRGNPKQTHSDKTADSTP